MVGLYDDLVLEAVPRGIHLRGAGPGLPGGTRNLVVRAARLLARRFGVKRGVRITLTKRIPVGAGLGGGSSDAAATLVGLNRLWKLGLDRRALAAVGLELGSDVPFFLYGPCALVGGRGERVLPVDTGADPWFVLLNPGIHISTQWAYGRFAARAKGFSRRLPAVLRKEWLTKLGENNRIAGSRKLRLQSKNMFLYNDLERVSLVRYPVIGRMKRRLRAAGAGGALMTGSGSTVFGFFQDRAQAQRAARDLRLQHPEWGVWAAKGLRRSPLS